MARLLHDMCAYPFWISDCPHCWQAARVASSHWFTSGPALGSPQVHGASGAASMLVVLPPQLSHPTAVMPNPAQRSCNTRPSVISLLNLDARCVHALETHLVL